MSNKSHGSVNCKEVAIKKCTKTRSLMLLLLLLFFRRTPVRVCSVSQAFPAKGSPAKTRDDPQLGHALPVHRLRQSLRSPVQPQHPHGHSQQHQVLLGHFEVSKCGKKHFYVIWSMKLVISQLTAFKVFKSILIIIRHLEGLYRLHFTGN